jgi:parallel beta-helix repeat protein
MINNKALLLSLICFLFVFTNLNAQSPLSGVYTINPSQATAGKNFQSFTDFGLEINNVGISGPVTINISPGTYNDQLSLGSISGSSAMNTLTINGSDATQVTLTHDNSIRNSTITLEGTAYTTIKNMTIGTTGTGDSWCIHAFDSAYQITIDSNLITMPISSNNDVSGVIISSSETSDTGDGLNAYDVTISNNRVVVGNSGISAHGDDGSSGPRNSGLSIINNRVVYAEDYGINVQGYDTILVHNNYVDSLNNSGSDGFYMDASENFEISSNYFKGQDNGMDSDDLNYDFPVSSQSQIYNNFFIGGDDAFYLDDAENIDIFHNSTYAENYGIRLGDDANLSVKNNIFYSNTNYAFNSDDGNLITLDYNVYYTNGSTLINYGTVTYADIAAFKSGEPTLNVKSLEGSPLYINNGIDLHVRGVLANDVGDNTVGISVDYDGDIRPLVPSTIVDIGADEFTPPQCVPSNNLTSNVVNKDTVILSWSDNNTPPPASWEIEYGPAGFTQGNGTQIYTTNSFDTLFGLSVNVNYEWAIRAICGRGDTSNASARNTFSTPFLPLSGIYTINSAQLTAGTNFQSFTDFGQVINNAGINGPVTVNVFPGIYNDQLSLGSINGSSATNTITIDGSDASQVTLSHNNSIRNSTITLEGTAYTTIKNMTIETTGSGDSWGVHVFDSAHQITIDSNVITMPISANNDVTGVLISSSETSDTGDGLNAYYITISNNEVLGGNSGISAQGDDGSSGPRNYGLSIINNRVLYAEDDGIVIQGYDTILVHNNYVDSLNNLGSNGIYMDASENFELSSNYFRGQENGMDSDDLNFDFPVFSQSKIYNNFFIGGVDALYFSDAENIDIFHNTTYAENYGIYLNDDINLSIKNNIFYSNAGIAFFSQDGNPNILDYNIYHTNGATLAEYGSASYADLTAFQSAQPTFNINSIEGNPLFVSNGNDLHLRGILANDVGDNTVGVSVDYDGDQRPLAPSTIVDIGADEFAPPQCIIASNLMSNVVNKDTVILSWSDNNTPPPASWEIEYGPAGFSQGNGTKIYTTNSFDTLFGLTVNVNYDWAVRAICGQGDTSNTSIRSSFFAPPPPLNGIYTLDSSMATAGNNFQSFTDLSNALNNAGVIGAVTVNVAPNLYNDQFSLDEIEGVSPTNTVTINGGNSSLVTLTHDGSIKNSTVMLEKTAYLTIKNMTVRNTKRTSLSWGILMTDSTHHITIDSNFIPMPINGVDEIIGIMISGNDIGDAEDGINAYHITISNNRVLGGNYGISAHGDDGSSPRNFGLSITNNRVLYAEDYGINIQGYDTILVQSNYVDSLNNSGSDAFYLDNSENFDVSFNYFKGQDNGMDSDDLNYDNPVTAQSSIYNNFFIGGDDAMYLDDAENIDIFHNTAYAEDYGIRLGDDANLNLRNNIFYSNNDFAFNSDDGNPITLDYNVYYTNGSTLVNYGVSTYTDLIAFQSAQPTLNINSLQGDPNFINNGVDLHLQGTLANDVGDNGVGISIDYDGDTRPLAPSTIVDIGADEYTPSTVGIEENESINLAFSVAPNPSYGQFTIRSSTVGSENVQLIIRNSNGKLLHHQRITKAGSNFEHTIDLSGKAKGVYFITLKDGHHLINKKLIKL